MLLFEHSSLNSIFIYFSRQRLPGYFEQFGGFGDIPSRFSNRQTHHAPLEFLDAPGKGTERFRSIRIGIAPIERHPMLDVPHLEDGFIRQRMGDAELDEVLEFAYVPGPIVGAEELEYVPGGRRLWRAPAADCACRCNDSLRVRRRRASPVGAGCRSRARRGDNRCRDEAGRTPPSAGDPRSTR